MRFLPGRGARGPLRATGRNGDASLAQAWSAAARDLERAFARQRLPQLAQAGPRSWAEERFQLARTAACAGIAPGRAPSAAYLAKARRVVAQQLALAGYRLADLLTGLFPAR